MTEDPLRLTSPLPEPREKVSTDLLLVVSEAKVVSVAKVADPVVSEEEVLVRFS